MHESNESTATIPAPSRDVLTEILRDGAQRLLVQAIDAEVTNWIDGHAEAVDDGGRRGRGGKGDRDPRAGKPERPKHLELEP